VPQIAKCVSAFFFFAFLKLDQTLPGRRPLLLK
jgi:hypothetical protein